MSDLIYNVNYRAWPATPWYASR